MKKKVRIQTTALIVSALLLLGGCSPTGNDVYNKQETEEMKETERSDMSKKIPTEEQLKILKDAGMLESERQELQKEGMPLSTQSFVDTAQMMLTYLEEKYGQEFRVSGGSIPGALGGGYSIRAYATEGERAYEDFDVEYVTKGVKEPYFEDGYFALIKELEVQEYLQELAEEGGIHAKVIATLSGMVGEEYNKDTTLEELNTQKELEYMIFTMYGSGTTDAEIEQDKKFLQEKLGAWKFVWNYRIYRLVDEEEYQKLEKLEDILDFLSKPEVKELYDYRENISVNLRK